MFYNIRNISSIHVMALKKYISLLHIFFFTLFAVSVSYAKTPDTPTGDTLPTLDEDLLPDTPPQNTPNTSSPQSITDITEEIFQKILTRRDILLSFTPEPLRASLAEKLADNTLQTLSYSEWDIHAEIIYDALDDESEDDTDDSSLPSAPEDPDADGEKADPV